jgi:hypothetical protein
VIEISILLLISTGQRESACVFFFYVVNLFSTFICIYIYMHATTTTKTTTNNRENGDEASME